MINLNAVLSLSIATSIVLFCLIPPANAHVLSDTPPSFWQTTETDFYQSINNMACDQGAFKRLQASIIKQRNRIKHTNKEINRISGRIEKKEKKTQKKSQEIARLERKLSDHDKDEKSNILSRITNLRRQIRKSNRRITWLQNRLNAKQKEANRVEPKLITNETAFAQLNTVCESVAGVWQSDGYGYVVDILDGRFRSYNVTSSVCVRDKSFNKNESYFDDYDFFEFATNARNVRVANQDNIPYELKFRRINALPSQCLSSNKSSPIDIFEIFSSYFDQHYPFFGLYGVDWELEKSETRSLLTEDTSDEQLFNLLSNMLRDVKDGHILLQASVDGENIEFDANPFDIDRAIAVYAKKQGIDVDDADDLFLDKYLVTDIETHILHGNATIDDEEIIYYGMASNNIGYIAIIEEEIIGDDPLEDITLINNIMEKAIVFFNKNNVKAIIIDLSINYGGFDSVSRTIAERFAAERTLGYSKRAGDGPNAQNIDIFIEPAIGARYTGPVYLMTSNATISAGEILTLSLRALPNVTHVGTPTNGALSDQLEKKLAKQWNLTLSNEVYTDSDGVQWESLGITPKLTIPVFDLDDPIGNAHLDAVNELIKFINEQHP